MKAAFLSLAFVAVVAFAAEALTVDKLVKNADENNNKDVTVTGTVSRYTPKTSQAGNKYTNFVLKGENSTANVYFRNHLEGDAAPKDGDTVEVTGTFRKEKRVNDSFTVKNEIDATKKDGKKYGVKITKRKSDGI